MIDRKHNEFYPMRYDTQEKGLNDLILYITSFITIKYKK